MILLFLLTDATVPHNQIRTSYSSVRHHQDDEAVVPRTSSSCWQNSIFDTDSDENENYGFVAGLYTTTVEKSARRDNVIKGKNDTAG